MHSQPAWRTSSEALRDTFAQYGTIVEAKVVTDRDTGRSRGFGFVTFSDPTEAENALAMNNETLDGRRITVNYALDKRRSFNRSQNDFDGNDNKDY